MRKNIIAIASLALLLTACSDTENGQNEPLKIEFSAQKNDVPDVEIKKINGTQEVLMDGKSINAQDFFNKYCAGKINNETCINVQVAARLKRLNDGGEKPRGF